MAAAATTDTDAGLLASGSGHVTKTALNSRPWFSPMTEVVAVTVDTEAMVRSR